MLNTKLLSIFTVLTVFFAQVGNVAAAPQLQDSTLLGGTIQSIAAETDAGGVTTVLVTFVDGEGTAKTVRLRLETAASLGLVDPTTLEVNEARVGQPVTIDPETVIPNEEMGEGDLHPIAVILARFFGEDPGVVDGYHEDGFGFGVIAQALWISRNLTSAEDKPGDASLAGDLLQAKRDKDFEAFFAEHPEYLEGFEDTPPSNWGQFKKLLREKKNNLGVIVSEKEEKNDSINPPAEQEPVTDQGQDQDKGNDKDNGRDKDKDKGKDKDKNKP